MNKLLHPLLPLIVLMLLVTASALWVFIKSPTAPLFKFILIPMVLVLTIAVPITFVTLMGYAIWLEPPEKFQVISYSVIVEGGKKQAIELWVREKDKPSRLYVVKYGKELEKQLDEIKRGQREGMAGYLTRKGKGSTNRHWDSDSSPYQSLLEMPPLPGKEPTRP